MTVLDLINCMWVININFHSEATLPELPGCKQGKYTGMATNNLSDTFYEDDLREQGQFEKLFLLFKSKKFDNGLQG